MKRLLIIFLLIPIICFGQSKVFVRNGKALLGHITPPPPVTKKIEIFYIGMSITAGIGTSGTGSSASGIFEGSNAYPVKADSLLTVGGINVTPVYRVFPGQTAAWYIANDLNTTISLFDYDNYTDIYCVVDFGTNDLAGGASVATVEANLTTIYSALKAAHAKVIIMPILNRFDALAPSGIDPNRTTINNWEFANYTTIADAIADISIYPNVYATLAPNNATYFASPDLDGSSKLHPTSAGAYYLAQATSASVTTLSTTPSIPVTPIDYAGNFITAAGITDATQQSAIRTLVSSLITNKLWHRFAAIYPLVGGTSTTEKYNLRDPRDSDKAYRLVFTGTPTFDANGITFVSSSYADTKYSQPGGAAIIEINTSLHYFSKAVTSSGVDMGLIGGSPTLRMAIKFGGNSYTEVNEAQGGGTAESYSDIGLFTTSRANSPSQRSWYRNGVLVRNTSTSFVGPNPGYTLWIGGTNNNGTLQYPSNRTCSYAAIGYGLTAAEEAIHNTIVQTFESTLGR